MKTSEILKRICHSAYTPDRDCETAEVIREIIAPYCEKIETDALGNLVCTVRSEGKEHIALSAHMDKIGLVVTAIDKATGMLKFAKAGGIDMRTLTAARVKVIGKRVIEGCITSTPPHLMSGDKTKTPSPEMLYVDTGLSYDIIKDLVSVGDTILYDSPVTSLLSDRLTGAYMDNSAGCTAVINAVKTLYENGTENRITAVFTTREEVGKGGALSSFTALHPDKTFITDVSFGTAPGIPEECSSPLASGAMICISPILQKDISDLLIRKAEENNIPFTVEVMGSRTMTDSDVAVTAGKGILTGLTSVPLLNMHTPVETLSVSDVDAVSSLLYLASKGE